MIFKNLCKLCHEKSDFHALILLEFDNRKWFYKKQCYPHYDAWIDDHPFVIMSNLDYLEWEYEQTRIAAQEKVEKRATKTLSS